MIDPSFHFSFKILATLIRTQEVLQRADNECVLMEIKEAKSIAIEEVLEQMAKEEGQRYDKEIQREDEDIENRKTSDYKLQERIKHNQQEEQRKKAATKLHQFYLIWNAKKTLQRICKDRIRKEFHPEHHRCYYIDSRTNEISWRKPYCLVDDDDERVHQTSDNASFS